MKFKIVGILIGIFVLFGIVSLGFKACNLIGWGINRTIETAKKELDPEMLLKKYEWFKDASAQLDKKRADIEVYDQRLARLKSTYAGIDRVKWPREDREQFNLWENEVAGIKASFNSLAADYNAQMAKINWAFTNIGQLPEGADRPLPREYKPYIGG